MNREDAERRLNSAKNLARLSGEEPSVSIEPLNRRADEPSVKERIPEFLRPTIGALARVNGVAQTARDFDLSKGTVSSFRDGKVGQRPDPQLKSAVEDKTEQVRDAALEKLMLALGLITAEKLSDVTAKEASVIAASMSKIVEKTSPRNDGPTNVKLLIYAPEQRRESQYKVIEV